MLKPDQKDDLVRMMNDYMMSAAYLLTKMMNQRVELSTSSVFLANDPSLDPVMREFTSGFPEENIIFCSVSFAQHRSGRGLVLFSLEQANNLVAISSPEIPDPKLKITPPSFDVALDLDVVKEIGTLILNPIMGKFAEFIQLKATYSLPQVGYIVISEEDLKISCQDQLYILFFPIQIQLAGWKIKGALALTFSFDAMAMLLGKIDQHPKEG